MNRHSRYRCTLANRAHTKPTEPNLGLFRRAVARIYPAQDELAIFTMAVSISVLAIVHNEFRGLLSDFLYLIFFEGPKEAFQTSKWEGTKLVGGAIVLTVMSIASLVASFVLPFTRRRLENFVQLILLAHMIMIAVSHVVIVRNGGNPFHGLIACAFLLWFFGYCCGVRYRFITKFVADRQSTSREAFIAGMLATMSILICTFGLNWHWASCYAFAAINAVVATGLVVRMA